MKIKILALALSALALGFSACDDDDDDAIISTHPEKEIDGMSFTGKLQSVVVQTGDTTYYDGTLAFAATDSAYACTVTISFNDETYSNVANVVKTSNGFSFNNATSCDLSDTGFSGTISNDGDAQVSFARSVRQGRKVVDSNFIFSNTLWK